MTDTAGAMLAVGITVGIGLLACWIGLSRKGY